MTSDRTAPSEAYVWMWLPNRADPVVAGRIVLEGNRYLFHYGRSWLDRSDAIPIYLPELPLQRGMTPPSPALEMASCLRDGAPDAWGRRVIHTKLAGEQSESAAAMEFDELTYMLLSGSDRIGALDFQRASDVYEPREMDTVSLEELQQAAAWVEQGKPVPPALDRALFHGTSIGGARPKALLEDGGRKLIAKFSASNDTYGVVKAEFIAMRLASLAGLDVAPVELTTAVGKDVLLIERFDRHRLGAGWGRRAMVSVLTILGLGEMEARYAHYADLADEIRARFTAPSATLRELFGRMVFNVLVGNTDDHARNHAAFWDGRMLTLTPAYDICPQSRFGQEASQAMLIHGDDRRSRLATCLRAAPAFLLAQTEARERIEQMISTLRARWDDVCDEAKLTAVDKSFLWGRQILNPYIFEGLSR